MKKTVFIFLLVISLFCCNSKEIDIDNGDFLIFGHFYGMCVGEDCIETFKLTSNSLYEDTNDGYIGNGGFNFETLDDNKFEITKDLIDYFPSRLLSENNTNFGCPDCADGGGLLIEYSRNGVVSKWTIDQIKNNVPSYLHEFMDKINEKISLINN